MLHLPALHRKHCKMSDEQKGVLIRSVQPISFAHGHLLPGDVLMAFDGVEVACGECVRGQQCWAGCLQLRRLRAVSSLCGVPRLQYSPTTGAPGTMSSYGSAVLGRLLATVVAWGAR